MKFCIKISRQDMSVNIARRKFLIVVHFPAPNISLEQFLSTSLLSAGRLARTSLHIQVLLPTFATFLPRPRKRACADGNQIAFHSTSKADAVKPAKAMAR